MKKLTLIIICSVILAILLTTYIVFMYAAESRDKTNVINDISIPLPEEDMLEIGGTTYYFTCKKDSDCVPIILQYEDITAPLCANLTTKAEKWIGIPAKCECSLNKCVAKL